MFSCRAFSRLLISCLMAAAFCAALTFLLGRQVTVTSGDPGLGFTLGIE